MKKIDRKDFLKLGGGIAAGGIGGYVLSGAPFWGAQWLVEWTQDQYVPPKGLIKYIDSVNKNCPNGCEVSVRMAAERAVQIESKGTICPSCKNTLQLLYHPERIATPLKRSGKKGSGKFTEVSWDEAFSEISGKIDILISKGKAKRIAAINKNESLSGQLMERFIKAVGSRNIYYENSRKARETEALGGYMEYDFDRADFVLSIGARLAENWDSRIELGQKISQWKDKKVKFVHADTICTRTASMADKWLPVKPGSETILVLGITAYLLRTRKKKLKDRDFNEWSSLLQKEYTVSETAKLTGISEDLIKKTANEFYRAKNPVAVCGHGGIATDSTSHETIAVYVLNLITGSKAVSLVRNPSFSHRPAMEGIDKFMKEGEFEFLFLNESNPVYKCADGGKFRDKLGSSTVVCISSLMNESAKHADYILPPLHFLETGKNSAVKNEGETRDSAEIITSLATFVKKTSSLFRRPASSYKLNMKTVEAEKNCSLKLKDTEKLILGEKTKDNSGKYNLSMVPFEVPLVGDGDGMAFPYVLKSIGPEILYRGKFYIHINRDTAEKEGLGQDDCITVESKRGKIEDVYVNITDIVSPGTVAVPLGFGHSSYTKYGNNKGVNIKEITENETDPITGCCRWRVTPVRIG